MNKHFVRTLAPLIVIIAVAGVQGQTIRKSVSGTGFTQSANHFGTISGTFGQPVVGHSVSAAAHTTQGFWAGDEAAATGVKPGQFAPRNVTLLSNSPNPFSSATTIRFTAATQKDIELKVFAVNGDLVNTTRFLQCNAGRNEYVFPRGALLSGNYNYTLSDGSTMSNGAMTIAK